MFCTFSLVFFKKQIYWTKICLDLLGYMTLGFEDFLYFSRSFGAWQDAVRKDARCTEGVVKILDDIYEAIQVKTGEEFMDNEGSALYVLQRASKKFWKNSGLILDKFWKNSGQILDKSWMNSGWILTGSKILAVFLFGLKFPSAFTSQVITAVIPTRRSNFSTTTPRWVSSQGARSKLGKKSSSVTWTIANCDAAGIRGRNRWGTKIYSSNTL